VWFSIKELSKLTPPTEAEVRAHRRKYPWGSGEPLPQPRPTGELRLEIDQYPRVSLRHRYHDLRRSALEEQLNAVVVGIVRMAVAMRNEHARELRRSVGTDVPNVAGRKPSDSANYSGKISFIFDGHQPLAVA